MRLAVDLSAPMTINEADRLLYVAKIDFKVSGCFCGQGAATVTSQQPPLHLHGTRAGLRRSGVPRLVLAWRRVESVRNDPSESEHCARQSGRTEWGIDPQIEPPTLADPLSAPSPDSRENIHPRSRQDKTFVVVTLDPTTWSRRRVRVTKLRVLPERGAERHRQRPRWLSAVARVLGRPGGALLRAVSFELVADDRFDDACNMTRTER